MNELTYVIHILSMLSKAKAYREFIPFCDCVNNINKVVHGIRCTAIKQWMHLGVC